MNKDRVISDISGNLRTLHYYVSPPEWTCMDNNESTKNFYIRNNHLRHAHIFSPS
jgi:hypothetical protein